MQVNVNPTLLRWARERASLSAAALAGKLSVPQEKIDAWERSGALTLSQIERVAEKTHTPLGYLFLPQPPQEALPIPDFRTVGSGGPGRPSPELLDTIYQCEERQAWYRAYLVEEGAQPLGFVLSARIADDIVAVADSIRGTLGINLTDRSAMPSWEDALRDLVERAEAAGILVMRNGVVGNNTHRKLKVDEFRGFALVDPYAPLVFVNATDTKSAQMFTLVHELAHLWLGESAVSDVRISTSNVNERFCNQVAAEVLVPKAEFVVRWRSLSDPASSVQQLTRVYKVSAAVILIRAVEAGVLTQGEFERLYAQEMNRKRESAEAGGGDFYRTQRSRIGKPFPRAVIARALEGQTLYRDALSLLGVKKMDTFHKLADAFGVTGA